MLTKIEKRKSGFTIIEVMIVLAIAGLILLIVFLAVPALQRSAANTGRKDDAGRISSAINDFVSNSNGTLPRTDPVGWPLDCATILSDAGTLNQYTFVKANCKVGTGAANQFDVATAAATPTAVKNQALLLEESTTCPTTAGAVPGTGTTRQAALFYAIQPGTSGSDWIWSCIQSE
jgi:prepilin-type N-terminal cleavage/methylation domain-containing protein